MSASGTPAPTDRPVTVRRVAAIALPVVLSNATVPLQGAIDTAIIGNLGEAHLLAAVTLGAVIFGLVVLTCNFIQISTSGLTAQALGAGDRRRVMNTLIRGLLVASAVALLLNLARPAILPFGLWLFEGSPAAEDLAARYVSIRLWAAPAELANLALLGWFTGLERTRRLFEMQAVISAVNILLNLLFVLGFGWGVEGLAAATAIAAYIGLGFGAWRAWGEARSAAPEGWRLDWPRLLKSDEFGLLLRLNRDVFIRTLSITGALAWLTRLGSTQGDVVLSANGVLMQFVHISAYALDGFAMATETLVGQALGARDRRRLRQAVLVTTLSALALAAAFALLTSLAAGSIIAIFTNIDAVRTEAASHALWATCLPIVAVLAYQIDGVFFGAADGRGLRNAMLWATAVFVPTSWLLTENFGNHGLWASLWIYMGLRVLALSLRYPALEKRADPVHIRP